MGPKKMPTAEEVEDIKKVTRRQADCLPGKLSGQPGAILQNEWRQWPLSTGAGGAPREPDVSSTKQQVAAFVLSNGIHLDCNNIEACHPLPRRNASDEQTIIIIFAKRKHETALLKQGNKLKGTKVYINKHLTKQNADIPRRAHFLKKQRKIQTTWTTNCKVFIKLNGTPEEAKVLVVKNTEDLEKYQWPTWTGRNCILWSDHHKLDYKVKSIYTHNADTHWKNKLIYIWRQQPHISED